MVFMKISKTNRIILSVAGFVWLIMAILVFNIANINAVTNDSSSAYKSLRLFQEVLAKIKANYYTEVSTDTLMYGAIEGMLSNLDPHTDFFKPSELTDFNTSTKGEFGGLGITIDKQGDYIVVVSPMEGTPAYKMGIQAGDKIVKVDGVNVVAMPTEDVIKKMRGDKGTHVMITIQRPGAKKDLDFDIIRDIIKIKSIPYAFKLDNGVGYIRIRQFSASTTKELREELNKLEASGISGLVIDLRFNPGGLLTEAIDTVNEFIGKGKLVVFTRGNSPASNTEYYTQYDHIRSGYPVVVMVNEASASAAEIFAGSLQDWDKALVVGKTSFGKGSVQQLMPLSDGYGIKITTSHYYIKSGRCIHKELNDKLLRGKEVTKQEREKLEADAKKEVYHTQNGRNVYGGGGVTPDYEIEQSKMTNLEMDLRRKNAFFTFTVDYMVKHEDEITRNFKVTNSLINEFMSYAKEQGVSYTKADLDSSESFIKYNLLSELMTKKYGDIEGYKAGIYMDTQLTNTLKLFDKNKTLADLFKYATENNTKKSR